MICALSSTWDAIATDALACFAEDGEADTTMDQEEVIEMVLDADRYMCYGNDAEAASMIHQLISQDRETLDTIARAAFPHSTYGY